MICQHAAHKTSENISGLDITGSTGDSLLLKIFSSVVKRTRNAVVNTLYRLSPHLWCICQSLDLYVKVLIYIFTVIIL